jgi:hypothetical protein
VSCDDQGDGGDEGDEREAGDDEGESDTLFFLPFLRFAGGDMITINALQQQQNN